MDYVIEVIKAKEGDMTSCEYLINNFQEMAVGYAYSILHDFGLAEDAAQEAFILMLLHLKSLKEPKAFISWLRKLIFSCCTRIIKKRKDEIVLDENIFDTNSDLQEKTENNEKKVLLDYALSKLSEAQREAVILHYFFEKSYSDIAEYLGISEGVVANRIYYGKKKMKSIMVETMIDYVGEYIMNKNEFTKKVLNEFKVSFAYINEMTFINCFASLYVYLNKNTFVSDYQCNVKENKDCADCGNCKDYMRSKQEEYYFWFDTMCGNAAIRPNFAGATENLDNKPETIDFLMKFAGYEYETLTSGFNQKIKESIDANKPVIARMKGDIKGNFGNYFRVLIGYDNNGFIFVENNAVKNNPDHPLTNDDFAEVFIITDIVKPRYTLIDGLKKIESVMEKNLADKIWDECVQQFNYFGENPPNDDINDIKNRFNNMSGMSYYNFNCHHFQQAFKPHLVKDSRLDEICRQIDISTDNAHKRNWQIISLNEYCDWSKYGDTMRSWGFRMNVVMCLEKLKEYDAEILAEVKKAISILEKNY